MGLFASGMELPSDPISSPELKAFIDVKKSNQMLVIEARVRNLTSTRQELRYLLQTRKVAITGTSSTSQRGSCTLLARGEQVLSQTRVREQPTSHLKILLTIYRQKQVVAKDSVIYVGELK